MNATAVSIQNGTLLVSSPVTSLAKEISQGLVKGAAGQVAGLMISYLMPEGLPSYFDEVYDEIREIVKQEVAQNTINEINGRVNGTVSWLDTWYKPRKESVPPPSVEELFDALYPYVTSMYLEAVQTLMLENYAQPGLSVFTLAAGIHLGLIQEEAFVDPNSPADPAHSSFAVTVSQLAEEYSDHLASTYPKLVDARKKILTVKKDESCHTVAGDLICTHSYHAYDSLTGWKGPDRNKEKDANKDRDAQKEVVAAELLQDLGDPEQIVESWRALIDQPIPIL